MKEGLRKITFAAAITGAALSTASCAEAKTPQEENAPTITHIVESPNNRIEEVIIITIVAAGVVAGIAYASQKKINLS